MAFQVSKLSTLLVILTVQSTSFAQSTINDEARKVYAAAGMSGLRKSIAFDAPIGDLLSRLAQHGPLLRYIESNSSGRNFMGLEIFVRGVGRL